MLCPKCGFYSETKEDVCPECGHILKQATEAREGSAQAIRQGKRAREAAKAHTPKSEQETRRERITVRRETASMPVIRDTRGMSRDEDNREFPGETAEAAPDTFERRHRNVYDEDADEITAMRYLAAHEGEVSVSRLVNWIKIAIIAVIIGFLLLGGGWFFLKKTNAGQRILARMGKEASSVAYWAVGDEMMDRGDIDKAIECFEKAKEMDDKEGWPDVDGLLNLGSAYEAAGRVDDAAALYETIYTNTPSRT